MTTVDNHPRPAPRTDDVYDPDDVGLRNSPLLKQMNVNLRPSPSPEPLIALPLVSPSPSPAPEDHKTSNRPKHRPSPGDAVLVSFMADGKYVDVARDAGDKPLASDNEEAEEPMKGTMVGVSTVEREIEAPPAEPKIPTEKNIEKDGISNLAATAAAALQATERASSNEAQRVPTPKNEMLKEVAIAREDPMEDVKPTIAIPSIKNLYVDIAMSSPDTTIKHEMVTSPTEEQLPPMRQQSPKSGLSNGSGSNQITLPSISESIGDISHLPQPTPGESPFAQSPPGRPPPRFSAVPGHQHGSPPKSPNDSFRPQLPSPGRGAFFYNAHRRPSQNDGPQYTSAADYSSSNTETPSTDQSGSTPATNAIDRMSIDGITNPQIGGFQCIYPGCTAAPFQTQVRSPTLYSAFSH